ncbi:hypothetical protein UJ101_00390 [Flavobacteriaceae bacterium UJ101]|nr:hypothetical protein UJ101_00390 [Flavobacteriaceae bacterium UJ101]
MYQKISRFLERFFTKAQIYKFMFNISPMYRNTVGRVLVVSKDLHYVKIKIPLNYQNRNYVGAMFGGSMFSATDPIYMIQLMEILGEKYVVWDKAATIKYKRPGRSTAYAEFILLKDEINIIKQRVDKENEIDLEKQVNLVSSEGIIFAEVYKTLYIAKKSFYKEKMMKKKQKHNK